MQPTPRSASSLPLQTARCTKCAKLFYIRGKDPGWLTCYQCSPAPDSGCLVHSRLLVATEPAPDGTGTYTERSWRDPTAH